MARSRLRPLLAAALGTLAAGAGLVAVAGPAAAANYYGLAGYSLTGKVTSVSAQWTVPRIAHHSRFGHARTFVSVLYGPSAVDLQVGTTEDEIPYRGRHQAAYSAYWSERDTGSETAPHRFHSLHAGDVVRASEVLRKGGWTVTVEDLTTGWHHTVTDTGVGATSTTGASFMQEDPASEANVPYVEQTPVLPYPVIAGGVVFSRLRVNGAAPQLSWSEASYLEVASGVFLLPSKPAADGFSLAPPSGAALQYMRDSAQYNYTYRRFNNIADGWTAATAAGERYAEAQPYLAALKRLDGQLASQHWPKAARLDVSTLVASQQQVVGLVEQLPGIDAAHYAGWLATLVKVLELNSKDAELIHGDLGLPTGT